jgi:hypothetical protein
VTQGGCAEANDTKCRQAGRASRAGFGALAGGNAINRIRSRRQTFPLAFREPGGSGCRKVEDHASLNSLSVCWDVQRNGPKLSLKLQSRIYIAEMAHPFRSAVRS